MTRPSFASVFSQISAAALLAAATPAHAQSWTAWLQTASPWTVWLGGGSALLLAIALIVAGTSTAKDDRSVYRKPRHFEPMSHDEPQGIS